MPHSGPDWFPLRKETLYPQPIDLGELAVRLGSPLAFDRLGDVLFLDTFDQTPGAWEASTSSTSAISGLSVRRALNGAFSWQLFVPASSSEWAQILRDTYTPALRPCGLLVVAYQDTWPGIFQITHEVWDGLNRVRYAVRADNPNLRIQVLRGDGTWATVATNVPEVRDARLWVPWKLVVDPTTRRYRRLMVGGRTYDLSAFSGFPWATADRISLRQIIISYGQTGQTGATFIDAVAVTINEPL